MRRRGWHAAIGTMLSVAALLLASPASAAGGGPPALVPRLVTRSTPTSSVDVIISVPPSLRGDTLPSADFTATVRGAAIPVTSSRLAGAGLDVAIIIDPVGSTTDLAALQGAAVELVLGLPPLATVTLVTPAGTSTSLAGRSEVLSALKALAMTYTPSITSMVTAFSTAPTTPAGHRRVVVTISTPSSQSVPSGVVTAQEIGGPLESIQVDSSSMVDRGLATLATATGGSVGISPTVGDLLGAVDQVNSDIAGLYDIRLSPPLGARSIALDVSASAGSAQAIVSLPGGADGEGTAAEATPPHTAASPLPAVAPAPTNPTARPAEDNGGRGVHSWNFVALAASVVLLAGWGTWTLLSRRRNRVFLPVEAIAGETKARVAAAQRALTRLADQRRDSAVRIPERLLVALEAAASVALDTPGETPPDPLDALTGRVDAHIRPPLAARFEAIEAGLAKCDDRDAAANIAAQLPRRRRLGQSSSLSPTAHSVLGAARQAAQVSRAHRFGDQSDQVGRSLLATWPAREGVLDHVPTLVSRSLIEAGIRSPRNLDFADHVSLLVTAVGDAADRTLRAELELTNLRNRYVAQLEARGEEHAGPIVAMLLSDPIVTIDAVCSSLDVSEGRARQVIEALAVSGWLVRVRVSEPTVGPEWVAVGVIDTVTAAFDDPTTPSTAEEPNHVH